MDLDLYLDSIFNGFGYGFGFKCNHGLDWILDLIIFVDMYLDLDSKIYPNSDIRVQYCRVISKISKVWSSVLFTAIINTHLLIWFQTIVLWCRNRKQLHLVWSRPVLR